MRWSAHAMQNFADAILAVFWILFFLLLNLLWLRTEERIEMNFLLGSHRCASVCCSSRSHRGQSRPYVLCTVHTAHMVVSDIWFCQWWKAKRKMERQRAPWSVAKIQHFRTHRTSSTKCSISAAANDWKCVDANESEYGKQNNLFHFPAYALKRVCVVCEVRMNRIGGFVLHYKLCPMAIVFRVALCFASVCPAFAFVHLFTRNANVCPSSSPA